MKRSAAASPPEQESFAQELNRRVTERTAELTAANEQLKKELAEHKRGAEALREAELNFGLIVDSIPAPVAVTSPTGEVEALNQATLEYFGRTFEELKDWKSSDVVHPDDLQRTVAAQMEAHTTGSAYNVESRHRRADGTYRWFNVLGLPLRDAQGHILHWFHLQIDIDDRKRAEEALRSVERNLDQIINTIPTHIYVLNTEGSVEYVNQAVMNYTGLSLEDVRQEDYRDRVIHPEDFRRVRAGRAASLRRGEPFSTEQRVLGNDGQYRWFLVRYKPLLDERGLIVRWYVAAFDIEDRKRAEEALRSVERNLDQIINTIPALAWSARPDGSAEFFNQQYLDFVGLSAEQASGWGWTSALHPDDSIELANAWQRIMTSEEPGEAEGRMRGHDGEYRWFLFRTSPLRDEKGNIVKWYGINTDIDDRKRAEAQRDRIIEELQGQQSMLSESEQRFRAIFDEAGTGIALVDLQHPDTPIQNNRALQKMLGLTQEKLGYSETYDELTAASDREVDAAAFRDLCEGKRNSRRQEKHFILPNGAAVWANVIFTLLRDSAGLPRFIIAIHEDVTERKRAVERLQANRDLLALAQKSARAMSFDWYVQQEVNVWSPEQEALHGLPPGSFDGTYRSWKKTIFPPDWPILVKAIKHAEETGEVTAEWRVVWPDGSIHWLATTGQMFFDDQGKPFRMVGFTADVTRRKLAEEELRRSEAFLAEAQQLSATGSFSWRVSTDDITWSEQLYRVYELEIDMPLTLELIRTRVHPEDLTLYEKMVEQARNGGDDFEWQYRLMMPDGTIKYLHAVAHAIRDKDGELEYIAAVQDVTERRLSEQALAEVRSELAHMTRVTSLGALTASIAHEVNQPLSGIITNASTCMRMLDAEPPNVDGARETVKRTIRDGHRAADVITRLRALFGKKDITFEAVDLNEAAREVIALSLSDLQRNRVILRPQLADDLPMVAGDRVQLQQVVLNLVRNALDAMSTVNNRPRHLMIKTEPEEGDQVRLSVQDAGIGFDPQAIKKLFEAFYTTKNDGMGIGLSVSRSIIESHHGRLWATPNDGPGAIFSFSLPRARQTNTKA
jgi:PAS domain S-box-containing protein